MYNYYELNHMIKKYYNGGVTEADGRASAPVGPSVATPLISEYVMSDQPW